MGTITLNKTAARVLLAHTVLATATQVVGSAIDVSTMVGPATAMVKMGRAVANVLAAGVAFRLEGSAKTSGNDEWVPIYEWASSTAVVNASTVNDAAFAAADTSFTIASATGITGGDLMYLRETGVPADSEWVRVGSVAALVITLEQAVTRGHTNGIAVTDGAEMWSIPVDIAGHVRIRLVANANNVTATGFTVDLLAWLVTADSANTV